MNDLFLTYRNDKIYWYMQFQECLLDLAKYSDFF